MDKIKLLAELQQANAKIQELEWKDKMQGEQLAASESTITELEQQLKDEKCFNDAGSKELNEACSRVKELEQQLKKAESVIEFYGKQDNWAKSFMGIPSCITNQEDHEEIKFEGEKIHCGGKLARQYLKSRGE